MLEVILELGKTAEDLLAVLGDDFSPERWITGGYAGRIFETIAAGFAGTGTVLAEEAGEGGS